MVKPRAQLHNLSVCEHGGKPGTAKTSAVIDFSTNLNPYGPPGFLSEAINEAIHGLNRYPDNECRELRAKISNKFGCREEEVQVGVIDRPSLRVLRTHDPSVAPWPYIADAFAVNE